MRADFPLPDLTWEPTRPYWEGAARQELTIPRCDSCDRLHWYPTPTCRSCAGASTVLDKTEVIDGVTTRVVDVEPGELDFEMPLQAVFRPLRFDRVDGEVIAPLFTRRA